MWATVDADAMQDENKIIKYQSLNKLKNECCIDCRMHMFGGGYIFID